MSGERGISPFDPIAAQTTFESFRDQFDMPDAVVLPPSSDDDVSDETDVFDLEVEEDEYDPVQECLDFCRDYPEECYSSDSAEPEFFTGGFRGEAYEGGGIGKKYIVVDELFNPDGTLNERYSSVFVTGQGDVGKVVTRIDPDGHFVFVGEGSWDSGPVIGRGRISLEGVKDFPECDECITERGISFEGSFLNTPVSEIDRVFAVHPEKGREVDHFMFPESVIDDYVTGIENVGEVYYPNVEYQRRYGPEVDPELELELKDLGTELKMGEITRLAELSMM